MPWFKTGANLSRTQVRLPEKCCLIKGLVVYRNYRSIINRPLRYELYVWPSETFEGNLDFYLEKYFVKFPLTNEGLFCNHFVRLSICFTFWGY